MKRVALALFATLIAGIAHAQLGDPPLEQFLHCKSADHRADLTVRYHGNHTFEFIKLFFAGHTAEDRLYVHTQYGANKWTGKWWIEAGKFWFSMDPPAVNTAPQSKPLGNLIGTCMAPGFAAQAE
ncbi:MAG: hypothetical protein ACREDY_02725 [Bradyrhizobium sp.]